MIQRFSSKYSKGIALVLSLLFYSEFVFSGYAGIINSAAGRIESISRFSKVTLLNSLKPDLAIERLKLQPVPTGEIVKHREDAYNKHVQFSSGPSQPEMQTFQSVNSNNMVDLFSGDFSYNIPLMDVGGYPVNIAYRSGVSMDQEASWVGLGWNINPGTVTRNLRGLPDDFNGGADTVRKTTVVKENKTIGVTAGAGVELVGLPIGSIGASLGVFHNNYKGWGMETGLNASINAGKSAMGAFSGGLSITNNSQDGLSLSPSLSYNFATKNAENGIGGSLSMSTSYNNRTGLKSLQFSAGLRQNNTDKKNQENEGGEVHNGSYESSFSTGLSFASPSYTPVITLPFTNNFFSFTAKVGGEVKPFHANASINGYISKQRIKEEDRTLTLPAFGYLNFQNAGSNSYVLLDYNREKDIPYREKPAIPNIAVPGYTYDLFSITGEGTGGMFRPFRGDIGFVYDHSTKTKDESARLSVDVGFGDLFHGGADLNLNRSYTQNGPWLENNTIRNYISFRKNNELYESNYFKNAGEKAINPKSFYSALGGDDVISLNLNQPGGISNSSITATNFFNRYSNKKFTGKAAALNANTAVKTERDKRSQVISYLTAKEASEAGLSKYIENYVFNHFDIDNCPDVVDENLEGTGTGLIGEYYANTSRDFRGTPCKRLDPVINFNWDSASTKPCAAIGREHFSVRWTGRIKAPVTGAYNITLSTDDGVRLWINDSLFINDWNGHPEKRNNVPLNLVAGNFYKIKIEYFQDPKHAQARLYWNYTGHTGMETIPTQYLYPPETKDIFQDKTNRNLFFEKRINGFRRENHISEIDVLNTDGRRYIYGIPVYNLKQKEATFSVDPDKASINEGLVAYQKNIDNTVGNKLGKDNYFSAEETPAYAHSFLLTGILSPDYVDFTGNGISDDDAGDAVKFKYSKICGLQNAYKWRTPFNDSAAYNEGLKTYNRDDKGSYVYGEKELWYLNSIESKTMLATFVLDNRNDVLEMNEDGNRIQHYNAKLLKEINLYSKAEFIKNPVAAKPIKTVHFEYSYELCPGINRGVNDGGKLTLKKIWFTYNGNNKGKLNPYIFNYHKNNPAYNAKYYDRWGNYKDPLQNPYSVSPAGIVTNSEYPYALQDSMAAAYNAAAWTLDSIILPSGGRMKITYESDDYAFVQNKRAMQMFTVAGFGSSASMPAVNRNFIYPNSGDENLYVFINIPSPVKDKQDLYARYLEGIKKLYFKLKVKMPNNDGYSPAGADYENVPCYADIVEGGDGYGIINSNRIWLKIKGIDSKGMSGTNSPLATAAIQFLRLNLPSKAYPHSEPGDDIDLRDAVQMVFSMYTNIKNAFESFNTTARNAHAAQTADLNRSYIRLNNPLFKRYGGGLRVKRVKIYDNWSSMTGQKESVYGQEYDYTTTREINGIKTRISSGVAAYEPMIGGEENPFHQPLEYVEKVAPLAPVTLGYTEEPLGESFFPSAGVGYSKVRVRTINVKGKKSANGYEETNFYTAYDFPTIVDNSMLADNKKRYKSPIADFLRINARHYMAISQGFKIELNDMHGKVRSQATFPETDPDNYISYTENYYKVDDRNATFRHLANDAWTINAKGEIDTTAIIGKDMEVMMDMREEKSVTNGNNFNVNGDLFTIPFPLPPVLLLPSLLGLAQREENLFRSSATTKVIQRYGILDSIVHIEKGSKVSTKNMLYDSETGDVLLTRTQNEFNDPIYNFSYPSHWAYDGMGLAYKNILMELNNITIRAGKITPALASNRDTVLFSTGDEILVAARQKTSPGTSCPYDISTFPAYSKIWAVNKNEVSGGNTEIYFIDKDGNPFSGDDVDLKVIRSGRRNMFSSVGSVSALINPLVWNNIDHKYELVINDDSKVLNTGANEFKEFWKVADKGKIGYTKNCIESSDSAIQQLSASACTCLAPLFSYLINSHQLFIQRLDNITVDSIVKKAKAAGYYIDTANCSIIKNNISKPFYALTSDSLAMLYQAKIGDCIVNLRSTSGAPLSLYRLKQRFCFGGKFLFMDSTVNYNQRDTVTLKIPSGYSVINYFNVNGSGGYIDINKDSVSDKLSTEYHFPADSNQQRWAATSLKFNSFSAVPRNVTILSAQLNLFADLRGHAAAPFNLAAHTLSGPSMFKIHLLNDFSWNSTTPAATLFDSVSQTQFVPKHSSFENFNLNIKYLVERSLSAGDESFNLLLSEESNEQYSFNQKPAIIQNTANKIFNAAYREKPVENYSAPVYKDPLPTNRDTLYSTFYSKRYQDISRQPFIEIKYLQPVDSLNAALEINSCKSCDSVISQACYSMVTDTISNPYITGVLGNYRSYRAYTYYADRGQSDPSVQSNLRVDGAFSSFSPFWKFQNSALLPQYDESKWVWNSEMTLFNNKGYEVENKDPLGRYNAGMYGYSKTLPVAVTQNSRYQEAAFDGFEDYDYSTGECDNVCTAGRHFDFTAFKDRITNEQSHTGLYSLRVGSGSNSVSVAAPLKAPVELEAADFNATDGTGSCGASGIHGIKTGADVILPRFSLSGRVDSILVSAWVKEIKECNCESYINNEIAIVITKPGNVQSTVIAKPSGNIIEGWQRYEQVIDITDATNVSFTFRSTGTGDAYFDDIRIHPFNANMKSFVYHPVNLRLMAELDENNYASFYEYDDDGTLIRVKKETERGIKTIKETRSGLIKDN